MDAKKFVLLVVFQFKWWPCDLMAFIYMLHSYMFQMVSSANCCLPSEIVTFSAIEDHVGKGAVLKLRMSLKQVTLSV